MTFIHLTNLLLAASRKIWSNNIWLAEHFQIELTESLKNAGGNITDITMDRHSEMVGVSQELGKLMKIIGTTRQHYSAKRKTIKFFF